MCNRSSVGVIGKKVVKNKTKIYKKVPKKAQKKHFFTNNGYKMQFFIDGAPEPTRTVDPQLRRLLLYPTELQAQRFNNIIFFLFRNKA